MDMDTVDMDMVDISKLRTFLAQLGLVIVRLGKIQQYMS